MNYNSTFYKVIICVQIAMCKFLYYNKLQVADMYKVDNRSAVSSYYAANVFSEITTCMLTPYNPFPYSALIEICKLQIRYINTVYKILFMRLKVALCFRSSVIWIQHTSCRCGYNPLLKWVSLGIGGKERWRKTNAGLIHTNDKILAKSLAM